jgi:small subunit ribosomal protein S1
LRQGEDGTRVWADVTQQLVAVIDGPVTSLTKFGAFVQVSEGVEGMIHIGDMAPRGALITRRT